MVWEEPKLPLSEFFSIFFEVVVQPLSRVQLFATAWAAARQAYPSFTISRSLHKLMPNSISLLTTSREGDGSPLQYSCLEHPMDRRAWRATVHAVADLDTIEQTKQQRRTGAFPFFASLLFLSCLLLQTLLVSKWHIWRPRILIPCDSILRSSCFLEFLLWLGQ